MELTKALEIIAHLADGIDPHTVKALRTAKASECQREATNEYH